jgi:hypothetical protein
MPSTGQTWVLACIGAVIEMGILSTLKRLLMESTGYYAQEFQQKRVEILQTSTCWQLCMGGHKIGYVGLLESQLFFKPKISGKSEKNILPGCADILCTAYPGG